MPTMLLVLVALLALLPSALPSTPLVPNEAGVQVFVHGEDGYNCTRIPTVILAGTGDGSVLLAFAEVLTQAIHRCLRIMG